MIMNKDAVKIQAQVKKIVTGEIQVKIERWVKGIGWATMDMYFTPAEYDKFIQTISRVDNK
jgi:hypothetical protein